MLAPSKIEEIAGSIARTRAADVGFARVVSASATDSEGGDALRITLVLRPEALKRMTGEKALNVLVDIQQELERSGEQRLAIIEYATEQELAAESDQERGGQDEDDA